MEYKIMVSPALYVLEAPTPIMMSAITNVGSNDTVADALRFELFPDAEKNSKFVKDSRRNAVFWHYPYAIK